MLDPAVGALLELVGGRRWRGAHEGRTMALIGLLCRWRRQRRRELHGSLWSGSEDGCLNVEGGRDLVVDSSSGSSEVTASPGTRQRGRRTADESLHVDLAGDDAR